MKKITLVIASAILSVTAFSQVRLGLQVSGTVASANVKSKYDINFEKGNTGLPGVSAIVQYDMGKHFSLRSGITYLQHGVDLKYAFDEFGSTTSSTKLNYLQAPLQAIYSAKVGSSRLYAGLGGYGGYGLSGTVKNTLWFHTDDGGYEITEELKAFEKLENDGGDLKRFDYGLIGLAGVELKKGLYFEAGYQQGLANISHDQENSYKNNGVQFTLGYFFK